MPGPHDFTFVSRLAFLPHCGCFGRMMFQFHLSPLSPSTLGALGHMIYALVSHLSSLSPSTLGALGHMILHLSPNCLPTLGDSTLVTLVFHLSRSLLRRSWPDDFTLVSLLVFLLVVCTCLHLSPTCFGLLWTLDTLGLHAFTLVSTCLLAGPLPN